MSSLIFIQNIALKINLSVDSSRGRVKLSLNVSVAMLILSQNCIFNSWSELSLNSWSKHLVREQISNIGCYDTLLFLSSVSIRAWNSQAQENRIEMSFHGIQLGSIALWFAKDEVLVYFINSKHMLCLFWQMHSPLPAT